MAPELAPPDVRNKAKPQAVLVSFLGDSTYNWLKEDCLVPFAPHCAELCVQPTKSKASLPYLCGNLVYFFGNWNIAW